MKYKQLAIGVAVIAGGLVAWKILAVDSSKELKFSAVGKGKLASTGDPMRLFTDLPIAHDFADYSTELQKQLFVTVTEMEVPKQASVFHGKYSNRITRDNEPLGGGYISFRLPQEIADQIFEKMGPKWNGQVTPDEKISFSDMPSDATKRHFGHNGRSMVLAKNANIDSQTLLVYNNETDELMLSYRYGNQ